jgi:hypothetical protein
MARRAHDIAPVRKLFEAGVRGSRAISRETGIPESTVRSYIKTIQQEQGAGPEPHGRPPVTLGAVLAPEDLIRLKALLKWWQQREEHTQQPTESTRDLVRWTVYVDRPHKEAIEAEASAERASITSILNRALDAYYAQKSTGCTSSISTSSTSTMSTS